VNNFVVNEITFIANKKLAYSVICITINFMQPQLDIVETFHVSDIINNNDSDMDPTVGKRKIYDSAD
jgi:hypothetical protein